MTQETRFWVVSIEFDPQWEDLPDTTITRVVGVCDSCQAAKQMAQQAVQGEIVWCDVDESQYYEEAHNPAYGEINGIEPLRLEGDPVTFLCIHGCLLNEPYHDPIEDGENTRLAV